MSDLLDKVFSTVAVAFIDRISAGAAPATEPPAGVVDAQVVEVRPGSIGAGLVDCRRRLERIHELMRLNDAATGAEIMLHAEWVVRFIYNNVLHPDTPCGADGWDLKAVRRRKAKR